MINLLFTGNDYAFDGMLTAALSIIKYNKEPISVFVMTMDLTSENEKFKPITETQAKFLENVYKSANAESKVILKNGTGFYKSELAGNKNSDTKYTPYTLLRLFADRFEDFPDKILYLDTDVMLRGDVRELYDEDVEGYEFAGALDHYGRFFISSSYVNAGVLLLNIKLIKETGLFKRALDRVFNKKMLLPDQTALHKEVRYKRILPAKYNEQKKTKTDTLVRHFAKTILWLPYFHTKNIKPWQVKEFKKQFKTDEFDDVLDRYVELRTQFDLENQD